MKCVVSSLIAILSFFLIIQANGFKIFENNKLNEQYTKIQGILTSTGINLLKLRLKSLENLELALSNVVESFDNFINNNENDKFLYDIEIVMYCLTETGDKIFETYREEKLAIKQLYDENLSSMELVTLSFFKVQ